MVHNNCLAGSAILHPLCLLFVACNPLFTQGGWSPHLSHVSPSYLLSRLADLWGCSANVLTPIGNTSSWCHRCHLAQTPKTSLVLKEMSMERFWLHPLADFTGLTKHLVRLEIESELLHCLSRETSPGPPQSHFHLQWP